MRFAAIIALGLLAVPACTELEAEGDRVARQAAKGVVNGVVSRQLPGVNVAPLTDCIIDNAEIGEVYQIAEAALVGPTSATTDLVLDIARRPETVRCTTDKALDGMIPGLG